jgi:two-component system response regulator NreC
MTKTRILIDDDHAIMRSGLRMILEKQEDFEVVGDAADGRAAVQMAAALKPDVVVMDIAMPNLNGIDATRQISAEHPDVAVVVLSMNSDEAYIMRALKSGAKAYLLKDSADADLIQAVRAVCQGKSLCATCANVALKTRTTC